MTVHRYGGGESLSQIKGRAQSEAGTSRWLQAKEVGLTPSSHLEVSTATGLSLSRLAPCFAERISDLCGGIEQQRTEFSIHSSLLWLPLIWISKGLGHKNRLQLWPEHLQKCESYFSFCRSYFELYNCIFPCCCFFFFHRVSKKNDLHLLKMEVCFLCSHVLHNLISS